MAETLSVCMYDGDIGMKASRVMCVLFDATNFDVVSSPETKMPTLKSLFKNGLFVYAKTVLPSLSGPTRQAAFSGAYPNLSWFTPPDTMSWAKVSQLVLKNPVETVFDVAHECGYKTIISGGWEGDGPILNSRGSVSIISNPKGTFTSRHVVDLACQFIGENPDFKILFTDFLDSDAAGHRFGTSSKEYRQALEYEDRQLKRLIEKLKAENLMEGTLWIIFTDHNMAHRRHGRASAINTWIILYGDVLPEHARGKRTIGTILDICPTICDALQIRQPEKCRATSILARVL